jgi:hypothetical protein
MEGGQNVSYREVAPHPLLTDVVCYYWELKSGQALDQPFKYHVVADGCMDLFFDMQKPGERYAVGFTSSHTSFFLGCNFHYIGVRFFPGAIPRLWDISAAELRDACHPVNEVLGPAMDQHLEDNWRSTDDLFQRFDRYLVRRSVQRVHHGDWRVSEALYNTFTAIGPSSVSTSRHLRRLFSFHIGASPKEFSRVVRFQQFLGRSVTGPGSYYDLGYFDQSHFIKDFKAFYGTTPFKAGV